MGTAGDKGKVGMPVIDSGMNKIAPTASGGGKGSKIDGKIGKSEEKKILEAARKRMTRCVDAWSENNKRALDDLKFKNGEQWPADVQKQRGADQRPCLTVNMMLTFVHQVVNDLRQNRPQIKINPVGEGADQKVAKHLGGLIRAIERDSNADIAYDTMADSAVSNGFGFLRVVTEYEQPDTFDQVIHIKRVRNPMSVYLDPDCQEPDGADARYVFVSEMVPRDEFKDLYPGSQVVPWQIGGIGDKVKGWADKDNVRVAEYFDVVMEKRTLVALSNGHVGWFDELDDDVIKQLDTGKLEIVQEREAECRKIKWYKMTALEILESRDWMGEWIPIVMMVGDEIDIEGKVNYSGLLRFSKDAQRMYNYWVTWQTELIALGPKAQWLMEEGQLDGHEDEFKNANNSTTPVLTYKASGLAGIVAPVPQQIQPRSLDQNLQSVLQNTQLDMMKTTGVQFDNGQQARQPDASGRAIIEGRRSSDLGSYHYGDNMSRSLVHLGKILLDLIPKVYDTKRMVTLLQDDDKEKTAMVDPNAQKPLQQGQNPLKPDSMIDVFNPTIGRYGVTVTTGPSYATRRIEAAESMMQFAQAMPQTAQLIADLIAKNMDWEGSDEMARRLAAAVPPQLMRPALDDVPPQIQALLGNMDSQIKQLTMQLQTSMLALKSKDADRAIQMRKISMDFEAKILGVVQKAEAAAGKDVGQQLKNLADEVVAFTQELYKPDPAQQQQPQQVA